jgi:2-dehydro-3-deoxygluconokinase
VVAFKAGAREAGLYTSKGSWARPVSPVTVVDAVGAGDGFATDRSSRSSTAWHPLHRSAAAAAVGACAVTSSGDKDGLPDRHQRDECFAAGDVRTRD